jgi:hypothetical protein
MFFLLPQFFLLVRPQGRPCSDRGATPTATGRPMLRLGGEQYNFSSTGLSVLLVPSHHTTRTTPHHTTSYRTTQVSHHTIAVLHCTAPHHTALHPASHHPHCAAPFSHHTILHRTAPVPHCTAPCIAPPAPHCTIFTPHHTLHPAPHHLYHFHITPHHTVWHYTLWPHGSPGLRSCCHVATQQNGRITAHATGTQLAGGRLCRHGSLIRRPRIY